jgi:hypothetical protein
MPSNYTKNSIEEAILKINLLINFQFCGFKSLMLFSTKKNKNKNNIYIFFCQIYTKLRKVSNFFFSPSGEKNVPKEKIKSS